MEFNYEGQNEGNNGGIMMYNIGLYHRDLSGQFFVLIVPPIRDFIDLFGHVKSCGKTSIVSWVSSTHKSIIKMYF